MKTVITSPDGLFYMNLKGSTWRWTKDANEAFDFITLENANIWIKKPYNATSFNACITAYPSVIIDKIK